MVTTTTQSFGRKAVGNVDEGVPCGIGCVSWVGTGADAEAVSLNGVSWLDCFACLSENGYFHVTVKVNFTACRVMNLEKSGHHARCAAGTPLLGSRLGWRVDGREMRGEAGLGGFQGGGA